MQSFVKVFVDKSIDGCTVTFHATVLLVFCTRRKFLEANNDTRDFIKGELNLDKFVGGYAVNPAEEVCAF